MIFTIYYCLRKNNIILAIHLIQHLKLGYTESGLSQQIYIT